MAMNPLYRNEFYFFSNMYDDSLITDFYRKISAESYTKSIEYQQKMLGRKRYRLNSDIFYKAKLSDFKVNNAYNAGVKLPDGSRTLNISMMVLPVFHKKKFLTTYGLQYQKIPLVDFFKRNDIFDKSITLQIGRYRIMSAYLIQNIDKTITLAISNSNTDGILSSNFSKIIAEYGDDEPVWIFSDEITQAYYTDTTTTSAVSASTVDGYYDVKVPITSKVNNIGNAKNYESYNSWDCLISLNSNYYGRKLLVVSPCSLRTSNATNMIFTVAKEFIDMVKANGINFSIWFINRPNKKHILMYPYSQDSSPILNIDYTNNPSGNINIEVYEVDSTTMCRGRKLYKPEFTQVYFPNIFDFSTLNVNKSDLLIEVTEYSPACTNQIMTNSIQPLIDSLGIDSYTEYVVNDHDKNLNNESIGLKQYHPEHYPINFIDFTTGDYKDDFRGYILDKITKTVESDPYLAASYYKWMASKNAKVTSLSGTPKTFRFGTTKNGEFSGSNGVVMDTSVASVIADDIQYFTEAHSYITHYSSNEKCPAYVYVNGKYIRPTCIRYYKGMNYLFFPIRVVNNELVKYSNDSELVAASPITVDTYPGAFTSLVEVPKDNLVIESVHDSIKFFSHVESPVYSLDDVVVYNASNGEYLGSLLDLFDINLAVSEYRIEHPGVSNKVLISKGENFEYLLTIFGEIYTTMDSKPILIAGDEVKLNLNSFIDEMISESIISNENTECFTHKKINFDNLEFTPKDNSLVGMEISVYVRAFKHEQIKNSISGAYDATNNITVYEFEHLNLDPDLSRYFVYKNGLYDTSAKLTAVNNKYNSSLILTLQGNQTTEENEILIVHMPISYHSENFNFHDRVFYMKPAVNGEVETSALWPIEDADGIILQSASDRIYNSFSFENDMNIKFDASGHRLPPKSAKTNSLYRQYYDDARFNAVEIDTTQHGTVFYVDNDQPIFTIAKQNPESAEFDKNYVANPLDLLTYIGT